MTDVDDFLEHHGVKGMKWGVRKKETSANESSDESKSNKKRNAAIILGGVAVAGAITAGTFYAKKHFGTSVSSIPKPAETTKKFAESLANEPVGIAHSSRGLNRGYGFLRDGGMKNLDKEFQEAGLEFAGDSTFKRFGKDNEKVAARFLDPLGRKDRSGRPIGHDIILPKSMAKDVNNIDDVQELVWPKIKDLFAAYYRSEPGTYGPGY